MNREAIHNQIDSVIDHLENAKASFEEFLKSISPSEENIKKNTRDLRIMPLLPRSPEEISRYDVLVYNDPNNQARKQEAVTKEGKYVLFSDYENLYNRFRKVCEELDEFEMNAHWGKPRG